MTREEWLRHAVEELDSRLFNGDLDILNHGYQISCGRCPGKKKTECIQPSDNEDIGLDDFFPTTITVNFTIKDPIEMLGCLALECIHAFFNIKKCNKQFKQLANKYYFEMPYTEYHPSIYLEDILNEVYSSLKKQYGEFPGKPIKFPVKEQKDKPKNVFNIVCPECGYELKCTRKNFDKHNGGLPTCSCGAKMILEEVGDEKETEN